MLCFKACVALPLGCCRLQVRWLARLSDPAVRFVDKIIGEAVVSCKLQACCQTAGG